MIFTAVTVIMPRRSLKEQPNLALYLPVAHFNGGNVSKKLATRPKFYGVVLSRI